ncbi:MAG: flagellar biosynthesis protein FlhB [Candidatus Cloacimonetes bacterium]|nr:flagellar biosynthesis protein FlhB [Candidatus Cloacimonadota bacterium]
MADDDQGEKTEEPTAKRLKEAREKGNVARSSEVDTGFFLLMFVLILTVGGPFIIRIFTNSLGYAFQNLDTSITSLNLQNIYIRYFLYFWAILLPIGFLFILGGFISMILQIGWLITFEGIKPKFDIFELKGLKEIFSVEGIKRLVKGLVKLAILVLITWIVIRKFIFDILGLVNLEVVGVYMFLVNMVMRVLITLMIFYLLFATLDLVWSKFTHNQKLKMTKSQVKDEFKQMEGDPQVRRKILTLMMEESMKRMMQEVPQADVVITNPIHLAIAIKYDQTASEAPIAVAKGKRLVAEKIKELAKEHDIPIVEDKPLARLLYESCKVGREIDVQFYAAVAEILAMVYKMKNRKM